MQRSLNFFATILFLVTSSCSMEKNSVDLDTVTEAQVVDVEKECTTDRDCKAVNKDCCGTTDGIVHINAINAFDILKRVQTVCAPKIDANDKLCEGKERVHADKMPKSACVNNVCDAAPAVDETALQSACTRDAECRVVDKSCCNTMDASSLVAVNFLYESAVKIAKAKDCHKQRSTNPQLCSGTRMPFKRLVRATCVEKVCTIKTE